MAPQRPVVADQFAAGIVILVVALPVDGPAAVVRMQHCNFGFDRRSRQRRTRLGELPADSARFRVKRHGRSVRSHQRAVIFLLAIQARCATASS